MKKYKLIKEYPGSPKLGYIAIQDKVFKNCYIIPSTSTCDEWKVYDCDKYPEFWEPVVEKDYLITGYYQKPNNIHINLTGNFSKGFKEKYEIYQIKRLSDGEIFTIGDIIGTSGFSFPIVEFKLYDKENTILANCYYSRQSSGKYNQRLNDLQKVKQPLFKTEDGVNIFEGDSFYNINNKNWLLRNIIKINLLDYQTYYKNQINFSTKEKAEEYILMNKPVLSLNNIYESHKDCAKLPTLALTRLRELVKQKLNNNN